MNMDKILSTIYHIEYLAKQGKLIKLVAATKKLMELLEAPIN